MGAAVTSRTGCGRTRRPHLRRRDAPLPGRAVLLLPRREEAAIEVVYIRRRGGALDAPTPQLVRTWTLPGARPGRLDARLSQPPRLRRRGDPEVPTLRHIHNHQPHPRLRPTH